MHTHTHTYTYICICVYVCGLVFVVVMFSEMKRLVNGLDNWLVGCVCVKLWVWKCDANLREKRNPQRLEKQTSFRTHPFD